MMNNLRFFLTKCSLALMVLVTTACSYKAPFFPETDIVGYQPDVLRATHLIEDSAQILENYALHPELKSIAEYLPTARGVFIIPKLRDYGVVSGFSLGHGVLTVRTSDGSWSGPSFHQLVSAEYMPLMVHRAHSAIVVFRSDPILDALLNADGEIKAAPEAEVGVVNASNHVAPRYNEDVNVIVFTASDTADYLHEPFEHARLETDKELNQGLYGRGANPNAILYGVVGEPATNHYPATARRLRAALGP